MTSPTDPRSSDEGGGPVWAEAYGGATYGPPADEPTSGAPYEINESTSLFAAPRPAAPGYGYLPPMPTPADRSDAALAHYLGAVGILGPLIVFLTHTNRMSRWLRLSLVEAVNFHISVAIYSGGLAVVVCVIALITCGIGAILFGLLVVPWVLAIIYSILGGQAASRGELYEYPVTIRFIK